MITCYFTTLKPSLYWGSFKISLPLQTVHPHLQVVPERNPSFMLNPHSSQRLLNSLLTQTQPVAAERSQMERYRGTTGAHACVSDACGTGAGVVGVPAAQ